MEDDLTKRERRELRKQESDGEREHEQASRTRKKIIKMGSIVALLVLSLGYGAYYLWQYDFGPEFTAGNVHWHANIRLETCGQYRSLENLGSKTNHVGNEILHTHGDNLYHLEGAPKFMRETSIGSFFGAIGVPVSTERIYEYRNGDACPNGTPGMVKMTVNGIPIADMMEYTPYDNDTIVIAFG